jgi:hypothetical protein
VGLLTQLVVTAVLTFVVLLGLSLVFTAFARPKGALLQRRTASAPGEALLTYRVCNARLSEAKVSELLATVASALGADDAVTALALVEKLMGGLWVGGRVFVTSHRVVFLPNALNRAIHEPLPMIAFALVDITRVRRRFGFVTAIVDVETPAGILTVRGYKMKELVAAMEGVRASRLAHGSA